MTQPHQPPLPPDRRPYRAQSAAGEELIQVVGDMRQIWRQVGWHGQTGAFYALGEDPSPYEWGSFSPLWLLVDSERIEATP